MRTGEPVNVRHMKVCDSVPDLGLLYFQITTMKYDPNFPADLAISPSHHPQLSPLSLTVDSHQNVFGSSGQSEAIRKYGIAGRVW